MYRSELTSNASFRSSCMPSAQHCNRMVSIRLRCCAVAKSQSRQNEELTSTTLDQFLPQTLVGLSPLLLWASSAVAEETVKVGAVESRPANAGEYFILALPLIVYSLFSVYRAKVNPRVKISDFLFILAAAIIVGNILSIVIFKKRLF